MNEEVRIVLMLMCGCINDIAEKDFYKPSVSLILHEAEVSKRQLKEVQLKLEALLGKYPENELVIPGQ